MCSAYKCIKMYVQLVKLITSIYFIKSPTLYNSDQHVKEKKSFNDFL